MLSGNALKQGLGAFRNGHSRASAWTRRGSHHDGRNRLSNFWTPTQSKKPTETAGEDAHDLLVRAGFLRQAHSGIFHLLPLGLRVQDKIERLIDKHMRALGASKVSLSSLTSEDLWQRSGRLEKGRGSEFFRLEDRKGAKLLLSPTHEEEITTIVANAVHSHKQLPLRLYQVSRKYRDEARPRQGLLRGREFVMKDLYTFDATEAAARETYEDVRRAYRAFLDELRLPYLVANADSGKMGGDLSHEYHFASEAGEDTVVRCSACEYSVNEELYIGRLPEDLGVVPEQTRTTTSFISKDRTTLLNLIHPADHDINLTAVRALFPAVDPRVEDPSSLHAASTSAASVTRTIHDPRTPPTSGVLQDQHNVARLNDHPISLTRPRAGDPCPACPTGKLHLRQAVEVGHTFHLGTRYSDPLNLRITDASNAQVLVHMGCHGIGVSRLLAATAGLLSDPKGLNWPIAIAPYTAVVIPAGKTTPADLHAVYDTLLHPPDIGQTPGLVDVVIDDRADCATGWKLHDADLIGYPFVVVLGKAWAEGRRVELQCRRLGVKAEVRAEELAQHVAELSVLL
ncbi:hypothetical protein LTR53_015573 [Teratosphaeriaceae sp. CCFEE 6253]|nr:hypothetical protein LTR53_015573 [Teratosphaeriaceae sp. CCFEE 6253]